MSCFEYRLAKRMGTVGASPFYVVHSVAKKLESEGVKLLHLSVGEPGYNTSDHIKEAAIQAIRADQTFYTATEGTAELRAAIQQKFARDNSLSFALDQIMVSMGGVQAIFNLLMATVDEDDEVILPAPYFSPYISSIQLTGAKPVLLQTQQMHGFVPQASEIEALLTSRSRWLVLNSPSNPSGAVINDDDLRRIADVVRSHPSLMVLSDDMYEAIQFEDGPFRNILNVAPDLANRVVILNGVSKTYAMTGWRTAYLAGPREIISAVTKISQSSAFSPNAISQVAAIEALTGPQDETKTHAAEYLSRRNVLIEALKEMPELTFTPPKGTFFLLVNCESYLGLELVDGRRIDTDLDLTLEIMRRTKVALMPGSGFGTPGFLRISFAVSEEILKEAMKRLAALLVELKGSLCRQSASE